jgi:hypothetical protein
MVLERITALTKEALLGDLSAPIGSDLWCRAMRVTIQGLLDNYRDDYDSLQVYVEQFTKAEGWRHLLDAKKKPFGSYAAFCKAKRPHGLGRDPSEIDSLIAEGAKRRTAQAQAADPEVKAAEAHGGARNGEVQGDNGTLKMRGSNQADYLIRRLKRDRPDIARKLAEGSVGEVRIHQGIVQHRSPHGRDDRLDELAPPEDPLLVSAGHVDFFKTVKVLGADSLEALSQVLGVDRGLGRDRRDGPQTSTPCPMWNVVSTAGGRCRGLWGRVHLHPIVLEHWLQVNAGGLLSPLAGSEQ